MENGKSTRKFATPSLTLAVRRQNSYRNAIRPCSQTSQPEWGASLREQVLMSGSRRSVRSSLLDRESSDQCSASEDTMTMQGSEDIYSVVKRYADAWAANDVATVIDCYHNDIVFHYFGRGPLAGEHRGKAACLAVLKAIRERTNRRLLAIRDVLAGERFGIVVALEKLERDGKPVEVERLLKYTVRDGKLAECWIYDEDQRLVDELFA
jgi:ketosteroid isomerase-like protein